ncbi:ABC transporter permease subunit [Roseobacter sp.]|uniref:ABC transporter permease subunit n=1 Tax=Roseobacter sp. TaxID=1907202 RepID=UPI003297E37B
MKAATLFDHMILVAGAVVMMAPVVFLITQLDLAPTALRDLFGGLWRDGVNGTGINGARMLVNSFVLAVGVAVTKTIFSLIAAFALVYFRLPGKEALYAIILMAMFFPIETRILPTFAVTHQLGLLNTYAGMILPIAASGLGVLVFRQSLKRIPIDVIDAAKIDGAGPMRILFDIIIPILSPMIGALFVILFVLGWNQYVWPIMTNTITQDHDTLVRGLTYAGAGSPLGIALALLALLPPAVLVVVLQRWLMRGLTAGIH